MTWLRSIRGALGMGLTWACGWALAGLGIGVAARHRRFDELSLPRVAVWGALGGLLLACFPALLGLVGLAHLREGLEWWRLTAMVAGPTILLGSASATGSLMIARKAERQALGAGDDLADLGLTEAEKKALLGGR